MSTIARNTPTLAQIVAASNASGVSIADLIIAIDNATIADNTPAPMPVTVSKPRKPAQSKPAPVAVVKSADTSDFWSGPATNGQIRRINRAETAIDKHEGENSPLSVKSDFATAKDASDYYNELKLDMSDYGIKF